MIYPIYIPSILIYPLFEKCVLHDLTRGSCAPCSSPRVPSLEVRFPGQQEVGGKAVKAEMLLRIYQTAVSGNKNIQKAIEHGHRNSDFPYIVIVFLSLFL